MVLSLLLALVPADSRACELALVIAPDVSRSVDKFEYVLMRNGIGQAFLDKEITDLIAWMPGGMRVTVTQWGGAGQQRQAIGWRHLNDPKSVVGFVEDLVKINRGFRQADTSVPGALLHADMMFRQLEYPCRRQVIEVSGDGISNAGPEVNPVSINIAEKGSTINGLVVAGARPDPVAYYLSEVIRGPLSFVEVTHGYDDYDRAMKRKLLRELAPNLSLLERVHLTKALISKLRRNILIVAPLPHMRPFVQEYFRQGNGLIVSQRICERQLSEAEFPSTGSSG